MPSRSVLNQATIPPDETMISSLIVKPQAGSKVASELDAFDAGGLTKKAGVPLSVVRRMSGGAYVLKLHKSVTLSEARAIAARLMHNDPSLHYVEPDRSMHPQTTPTDPNYGSQWHYFAPADATGGANLPTAWDVTKGSASVVVAVVDTGYVPHADQPASLLQGYDFITDPARANDGDGRDSNPQDAGNWVAANECGPGSLARDSVWHGTGVTGIIAAKMNNGLFGTGVAPNVTILPVRVSGKCGAVTSDMADGMRWAAGLAVAGVPANANPAKVLNISISDHNACSQALQDAVTDVISTGAIIVSATGNNGDATAIDEPANCAGVIGVAANAIDGDLAYYSNVSGQVAITAPGGLCGKLTTGNNCTDFVTSNGLGTYTIYNTGTTSPAASPGGDTSINGSGTSSSTPHVSGVAALLWSVQPSLTRAQILSVLQSSARAFPAGSSCASGGSVVGKCGAGLLDARAALDKLNASALPPAVTITTPSQVVAPAGTVSLAGMATAAAGKSITSYQWAQVTGGSVGTIANSNTANASFTAPATGTFTFRLTATDSSGLTGQATATVRVNSPPVLTPVGSQTVSQGSALDFTVGATDADGDTPTFVAVPPLPAGSTLSAAGQFSWPSATPAGNYSLAYFARDNDADSAQGTVNITVQADSSGPSVSPAPAASPAPPGDGGGGGCTLSADGRMDMMLPMLALLAVGLWAQRFKNRTGRK
ncbi:MAG: S8 family serine peptidase [Nitrospira sp.]|nr:S8 family serine peptidase [Nitrospira sp.]